MARRGKRAVARQRRKLGAAAPPPRELLTDPKKPKARGVEERELPDGSWERVFHGESMKDTLCRDAMKETAEQSVQQHFDAERVRVQLKNDPAPVVIEKDRAEKYEREGQLRAVHPAVFRGVGAGRPGCDYCGALSRRLRYHSAYGLTVCKDACYSALDETRQKTGG